MKPSDPSRPRRVLVVEDSPDIQVLVGRVLGKAGYELAELSSAEGLQAALCKFDPDLILCDVIMPGQDGISVMRRLHEDPQTRSVPVIVMSAKTSDGDRRAALDAGAVSYLVKPFQPPQLLRAVEEALSTQMAVKIWGCRGSIPAPEHCTGAYGGNTSCVDLVLPGNRHLVFDAGTGIRGLGQELLGQAPLRLALFLTHYHWDHVQGLPFFKPLFVPGNEVHLYGPAESNDQMMELIGGQMGGAFFPISVDAFRSSVKFHGIQETSFEAFGCSISTLNTLHPGRTLAYRVEVGGRSLVYAPDNEMVPESAIPQLSGEALRLANFVRGASLLMHDCQYSREEYEKKRGWGHSPAYAVGAALAAAEVERILLFHHDPDHDDLEVDRIHGEFRRNYEARGGTAPSESAREGATYSV